MGIADSNFWKITYGTDTRDVINNKSWIVVNNMSNTFPDSTKLTIPWNGSSSKGNNFYRTGIISP